MKVVDLHGQRPHPVFTGLAVGTKVPLLPVAKLTKPRGCHSLVGATPRDPPPPAHCTTREAVMQHMVLVAVTRHRGTIRARSKMDALWSVSRTNSTI